MREKTCALALPILLTISVSLNLFQMRQLRARQAQDSLEPGTRVSAITARHLDAGTARISVTGGLPTLVYVFSPQCGWCQRNQANVDALAAQLRGRYNMIGVSLSDRDLKQYLAAKPMAFPVVHSPSVETAAVYKMRVTPLMVAVSPEGRVDQAWQGAFTGEQQAAIEHYFGVRLPGISI
jgi:hypothetical protein